MIIIKQLSKKHFSFIDWFLPLFMILAQYKIGGSFSNYGYIILIIYTLYLIIFGNQTLYIHKYLLGLTLFTTVIAFINMYRLDDFSITMLNRIVMPIFLFIVISTLINKLTLKNFYKSYLYIGSVAMAIMYYQSISLLIFGVATPPVTILHISPEDTHFWGDFLGRRPSSLFTEPQAYASFMLPLLILTIQRGKNILGLIISLSIFLSTSSLGILMVGFIYVYNILFGNNRKQQKIILIILIIISTYAFLKLEIFDFASQKISATEIEDNIRLVRGFIVYSTFQIPDMLFGINNNLQSYVMTLSGFSWVEDFIRNGSEHLLGYTTTVSGILIQFGLFAGILFFLMIYKMFKNEDKEKRIFLFVIIILSFAQTLFYNGWFVFYYILYLGICEKKIYNKNYLLLKIN